MPRIPGSNLRPVPSLTASSSSWHSLTRKLLGLFFPTCRPTAFFIAAPIPFYHRVLVSRLCFSLFIPISLNISVFSFDKQLSFLFVSILRFDRISLLFFLLSFPCFFFSAAAATAPWGTMTYGFVK